MCAYAKDSESSDFGMEFERTTIPPPTTQPSAATEEKQARPALLPTIVRLARFWLSAPTIHSFRLDNAR